MRTSSRFCASEPRRFGILRTEGVFQPIAYSEAVRQSRSRAAAPLFKVVSGWLSILAQGGGAKMRPRRMACAASALQEPKMNHQICNEKRHAG